MPDLDSRSNIPQAPRRDLVDETSDESFPASDPPGWSVLHLGAPRQRMSDAEVTKPVAEER